MMGPHDAVKTYLRSTMGHERLSGLALLAVHYDMDIDCEHVLNHFARKKSQKNASVLHSAK